MSHIYWDVFQCTEIYKATKMPLSITRVTKSSSSSWGSEASTVFPAQTHQPRNLLWLCQHLEILNQAPTWLVSLNQLLLWVLMTISNCWVISGRRFCQHALQQIQHMFEMCDVRTLKSGKCLDERVKKYMHPWPSEARSMFPHTRFWQLHKLNLNTQL